MARGRRHGRGRCGRGASSAVASSRKSIENQGHTNCDDVTFVYRKPGRRRAVPSSDNTECVGTTSRPDERCTNSSTSAASLIPQHKPESSSGLGDSQLSIGSEVDFWQRCARASHCGASLADCGMELDVDAASATCFLVTFPEERLRAALQALQDLQGLLLCVRAPEVDGALANVGNDAFDHLSEDDIEGGSSGCHAWVRVEHYAAVVALAQLCEAAVPVCSPSLVSFDTWRERGENGLEHLQVRQSSSAALGTGVSVTPSPVSPVCVLERLCKLKRLWQLRWLHRNVIPKLQPGTSVPNLCHILFSHSEKMINILSRISSAGSCGDDVWLSSFGRTNEAPHVLSAVLHDAVVSFPGITSRHRSEQQLLRGLLTLVNDSCKVDPTAWSAQATLSPLRLVDGVYVVHHVPRMHALRQLLQVVELYGLPPFLRSIRCRHHHYNSATNNKQWSSFLDDMRTHNGVPVDFNVTCDANKAARRALHVDRYSHLLYFAPDSLDPEDFDIPDPMQAHIVQEELIELTVRHCAFGLVVGEADQIIQLFTGVTRYRTALWERRIKRELNCSTPNVKVESPIGSEAGNDVQPRRTHNEPLWDPLAPYVRATAIHALNGSRQETVGFPYPSVSIPDASQPHTKHTIHWLCNNRYSSSTRYYALCYGVVLPSVLDVTDVGCSQYTALDVDGCSPNQLQFQGELVYYVNAVVELARSEYTL